MGKIRELARLWKGDEYDLVGRNCNHFCEHMCETLLPEVLEQCMLHHNVLNACVHPGPSPHCLLCMQPSILLPLLPYMDIQPSILLPHCILVVCSMQGGVSDLGESSSELGIGLRDRGEGDRRREGGVCCQRGPRASGAGRFRLGGEFWIGGARRKGWLEASQHS